MAVVRATNPRSEPVNNQEPVPMIQCPTCGQQAPAEQIQKSVDPMEEFTLPFKVIRMAIWYGLARLAGRVRGIKQ